ncbi:ATP-dependent DNA helicase DDM1 [Nymphaea colorata]|nr:ATP-dependent DNA helicase DDM1 [Nymphaea colorata]XP_031496113.1 ATP-dependent DNA helicase DDM1 [Nymphaea colorata]
MATLPEKKDEGTADSPISVLEEEGKCTDEEPALAASEDDASFHAKNGDSSLLSETMLKEEALLQEAREKEDGDGNREEGNVTAGGDVDNGNALFNDEKRFSKLEELLTRAHCYAMFLFEQMEKGFEEKSVDTAQEEKKRGRKRKASSCNTKKAKKALTAMLARSQEVTDASQDVHLSEEERTEREQASIVPLLTGGKLKPYQLKGVKWLISLWQNGLNGILADQMGLGKTIQTIAFLAHLKGNNLHGPYLIIAPLSTLSNWVNEIARFAPSMNAIIYHGDKQERLALVKKHMPRDIGPDFPLVVTSYEIAMNDSKVLARYCWKYVVIDEGHRLKNTKCKLLRELKRIKMENKLLLTGTPLQNNLAELWSLLNFILPDVFSSCEEFESWFDFSAKSNGSDHGAESREKRKLQVLTKLHLILRPFILRRLKEDVEKMLPRKKEIILYANMTEHQKKLQEHLVNKTLENYILGKTICRTSTMRSRLTNLFMQLRKNCNHPDLVESAFEDYTLYPPIEQLVEQCGKFRLLDRLISHLLQRKHKILIFSQMTKLLDLLDYYFDEKGLLVCRIDGSVKLEERQKQIKEFNDLNSNVNIFLLSTRAGGLGINLTAADTCILYDSDWNPQMDLQAMDRCHRIGQTKPVHVYRLATAHSVEGRMIKRAFSKLKLEHVVIEKGQFQQEKDRKPYVLEEEDLLALLQEKEEDDDKEVQTEISDDDLLKLIDRSDMVDGVETLNHLPPRGPGWEVVMSAKQGGSMLSSLES